MKCAAQFAVLSVCLAGTLGGASAQTAVSETKEDRLDGPATLNLPANLQALSVPLSAGLKTGVEILESRGTGLDLSSEDLFIGAAGAGVSFLSASIPPLKDAVDFRVEDIPAGDIGIRQLRSGNPDQKYLFALKLSGFDAFETTSLRFVELQAGYLTRGYGGDELVTGGEGKRRDPFIGIGIDLSGMLHADDGP